MCTRRLSSNGPGPTNSAAIGFWVSLDKGRINVTAGGGLDDFDLLPDGQRRSLNVRDKGLGGGEVGIDQHANAHGSRLQLMQQSKLLCPKLNSDKRDTGDIAARPVETGDEAEL